MRGGLYWRLTLTGIRSNRRLYLPWLLTNVGMVMMSYIIASLLYSPLRSFIRSYSTLGAVLSLGRAVLFVFAVILLFYTNAFLIRRRRREFGLYNVLGMSKRDVGRVLLRETLLTYVIALIAGLLLGLLFSKLAELLLCRLLRVDVSYAFYVSPESLWETAVEFAAIFALILLVSLARVRLSNPLQLMQSESAGEKPPKANWVPALLGLLLLAAAYVIAVSITEPVQALLLFFLAVVLVILGTYLLFISGSVALCRLLQKKKGYYYQTNHFISVSSMAFRMKRNGAGLASICILSTMVLVMLSSTGSLMLGGEASLQRQFPYPMSVGLLRGEPESAERERTYLTELTRVVTEAADGAARNLVSYRAVNGSGIPDAEGRVSVRREGGSELSYAGSVRGFVVMGMDDYVSLGGEPVELAPDEALIWDQDKFWTYEHFSVETGPVYRLRRLDSFPRCGVKSSDTSVRMIAVVVPDLNAFSEALGNDVALLREGSTGYVRPDWTYCVECDTDLDDAAMIAMEEKIDLVMITDELLLETGGHNSWFNRCIASFRESFYALNGGLFFLGILLSLVFVCAAVLIIYYKQVSEGYEDAGRYGILRKLGLSRRMIRRSVNSQVLTVFFAPLLLAAVHLAFSLPLIHRILVLFGAADLRVLLLTNLGCFLVFAVFYAVVYRITANVYLRIVGTDETKAA